MVKKRFRFWLLLLTGLFQIFMIYGQTSPLCPVDYAKNFYFGVQSKSVLYGGSGTYINPASSNFTSIDSLPGNETFYFLAVFTYSYYGHFFVQIQLNSTEGPYILQALAIPRAQPSLYFYQNVSQPPYVFSSSWNATIQCVKPKLDSILNYYSYSFHFPRALFLNLTANGTLPLVMTLYTNSFMLPSSLTSFDLGNLHKEVYSGINLNNIQTIVPNTGNFGVGRYEVFHFSIFVIALLFYCLLLCLLIVFRNQQPLKSRGVIPYIAIISQILCLCFYAGGLTYRFMSYNAIAVINCLSSAFLSSLVWLNALNFLRFSIISRFQKKLLQIKDDEASLKRVHQLRYLKHPLLYLVLFMILLLIFIVISMPESLLQYLPNSNEAVLYVELILFCLFYVVLAVIDIISNWKKNFKLIWKEDTLYFRFENYIVLLFICFPLYVVAFGVSNVDNSVAFGLFVSFEFNIFLFAQVIFILSMTIAQYVRKKVQSIYAKEFGENELDDLLLRNPDWVVLFSSFAESEWSIENLLCYFSIHEYMKELTLVRRVQMADKIYSDFLDGSASPFEINVASRQCKIVKQLIDGQEFDKTLFDVVLGAVKSNLADTYSRFILTSTHKNYMKVKNIREGLV